MAGDKQTTVQNTTQQATPTAEETELNKLYLEQARQTMPQQTELMKQGMALSSSLLTPDYANKLSSGISSEAIGQQASRLAKQYGAGFQSTGIADSGVAFRETARGIANELLYPTEQFNIGAMQNLLNLALSGQAQVQAPVSGSSSQLSSNLAGLRSVTSSGSQTTTSANPFLKSFQQSAGTTLGSPKFTFGGMSF